MAGVHARVKVNDGRAVPVPLGEREVGFSQNFTAWCDDDPVPSVRCSDDVGRLVHHDAGLRLAAPL